MPTYWRAWRSTTCAAGPGRRVGRHRTRQRRHDLGGEFLRVSAAGIERVAHLRSFGCRAATRRCASRAARPSGLLFGAFGPEAFARLDLAPLQAFTEAELSVLTAMLTKRVNRPRTSSAGRLFDAVAAALAGLRQLRPMKARRQ